MTFSPLRSSQGHKSSLGNLLTQKIRCLFTRKRSMERDFHDIIFLLGQLKSYRDYLKEKLAITSGKKLRNQIHLTRKHIDFRHLSLEVAPFLMH